MKARRIRTKEAYHNALARVEKLMDAKLKTPQGEELEILALLIEDYEKKLFPISRHSV